MSGEKKFLEEWRWNFRFSKTERKPFEFQGDSPRVLIVRCTSEPESATKQYSIIADYGWAERILFSQAYFLDAKEVGELLSKQTGIELRVEQ